MARLEWYEACIRIVSLHKIGLNAWATLTFSSGDSYSSTSFDVSSTQPSPTNPLGNHGWTSSAGPSWVEHLTINYNASILQTYNFAIGGAWLDYGVHDVKDVPEIPSLSMQFHETFVPYYGSDHPWQSNDTIFAFFFGINDLVNSWFYSPEANIPLHERMIVAYANVLKDLHKAGARNFLLFNIPPMERTPMVQRAMAIDPVGWMKADVNNLNHGIGMMVQDLKKTLKEVNFFVVDAHSIFNKVLDDPNRYVPTSNLKNMTGVCRLYSEYE